MTENTLHSWHPRQPAANLKLRIFNAETEPTLPPIRWLWGSLAPAVACALVVLTGMHRENEGLLAARPATNQPACAQPIVIFHPNAGQSAQNHLAAVTFEWTNRSFFQSSMAFALSNNLSK